MAEIISSNSKRHKTGTRSRRLSTKVDLTPMVDLGFLLITFFIFTTTATEAKAMKLNLPEDSPDSTSSPVSKTLNFILGANDHIICYHGKDKSGATLTNSSANGIRMIITAKRKQLMQKFRRSDDLVILIKPTSECSYQNVVDVLDEMTIDNVTRYVLMDPDEEDKVLSRKY